MYAATQIQTCSTTTTTTAHTGNNIYVDTRLPKWVHTHIAHPHARTHARMHTHTHTYNHTHTHRHTQTHTDRHTHKHTDIHTHTHRHPHTHTHTADSIPTGPEKLSLFPLFSLFLFDHH